MVFDFASDEKLLGIEEICQKLSISRTTFERLRKPPERTSFSMVAATPDDYSGMPPFPNPTIILGRSPRWSASTLNAWVAAGPIAEPRKMLVPKKRVFIKHISSP